MFSIDFISGDDAAPAVAVGRIIAGTLEESFEVVLDSWDRERYRASWRAELQRLVAGAEAAVLLTSASAPSDANWLRGYVLYRFGEVVRVQERIFLMDELPHFDPKDPAAADLRYESIDEDGQRLSEWILPLREVSSFVSFNS